MFNIPEDHFDSPFPTTTDDMMRHQADMIGFNCPEKAWILTSWDVWIKNPHYQGPEEPHPEDYPYEEDEEDEIPDTRDNTDIKELLSKMDGEIPF